LNVFFSYSFPSLLHHSTAGSKLLSRFNNHDGYRYVILVPFFIMMVVLGDKGRQNTRDSDEEIEVDNTYHGEEDEIEGDDKNENDSDDTQKRKEILTSLWKYVTRLGGGKRGGTTKPTCHHCHKTYTGSSTRVRKHLCGLMHWDEGKTIGVKTCVEVTPKDRLKYQSEEEEAQNKSKIPRVEHESSQKMFIGQYASPQASGFSPSSSRCRTLLDFLDQGCREDVDAKKFRFLYVCSIPFNVLRSAYWHEMVQAINGATKGYKSLGYDKASVEILRSYEAAI
jgi:hypothetical protein